MKVLVMGAGGVGGYYGGLLAKVGHDVTFVARGAHLEALQRDGLTVESQHEPTFTLPVRATAKPGAEHAADLVLIAVKTYDTADALGMANDAVHDDTTVLTLQNGVDSGEVIAAGLARGHVAEGPVYVVSSITSPGVVRQNGDISRVVIGAREAASLSRVEALVAELRSAGWPVEFTDHPQRELWTKLAFLGPLAIGTTLTGLPAGPLRSNEESAALLRQLTEEYVAVANAQGAELARDAAETALATLERYPVQGTSSMARDKEAGRRLEAEALVGSVVRRGRASEIATPATEAAYRLLAPLNGGA